MTRSLLFRYALFPATLTLSRRTDGNAGCRGQPSPRVDTPGVSTLPSPAARKTENRPASARGLSHPPKLSARRVDSDRPLHIRPTCKFAVFPPAPPSSLFFGERSNGLRAREKETKRLSVSATTTDVASNNVTKVGKLSRWGKHRDPRVNR